MSNQFRLQVSSESTETLRVTISAKENGVAVDPTGDTVEFAFPKLGEDESGAVWTAGTWDSNGVTHKAQIKVGPSGDVTLTDGTYEVWTRITTMSEVPTQITGILDIT